MSPRLRAPRQRGFSMIELMVALVIGMVLIGGAVYVYAQSRSSYGVNESVARLQESGRYAMSVIEPDIRMSSFYGLMNDPELIVGRAAQDEGASALGTNNAHECGDNFALDLYTTVEGSDNEYTLECAAGPSGNEQPEADTLTIRRASANATAESDETIQIWSSRTLGRLFSDGAAPGAVVAGSSQINDLIVNTYYVSADSDDRAGMPSLRRQSLVPTGAGPDFQDQEIIPGVEDFQVQLGIDPSGVAGDAVRYVDPDTVLPLGTQVVSVRVWLLIRAEAPEVGFVDGRTYTYGNRIYTPNDGFRRLLLTRTIQVRNSLG